MAVEKAKVLVVLSTKFKGKSLSKTYLDKLATRYAAKIETDADVDDYINEREDDIIDAGVEADRRVSAALKKPKEGDKAKTETVENSIDEDDLKDAPAYVKAMMKKMDGMNQTIEAFKAKEVESTLQSRFESHENLKGIPKKLLKGWYPKTEEEFENAVEAASAELKEFAQAEGDNGAGSKRNGFGTDRPGFSGGQQRQAAASGSQTKVPEAITQFTDQLNKQSKKP
jgi:FMN-dependent NADH-azoreductase